MVSACGSREATVGSQTHAQLTAAPVVQATVETSSQETYHESGWVVNQLGGGTTSSTLGGQCDKLS